MRTNINTIDKTKFQNYIIHKNAQELSKWLESKGKTEWANELKKVQLETASADVRADVRAYVLADVRAYVLADVRAYVLADVRAYVLAYVRAYVLADVRAYVRAYVLAYVRAYVLADVRAYVLAYVRADVRADVLADVRADVLKEFTNEYIEAYIYAGGKRSSLKVAKLNTKLLKDITAEKWFLNQRSWHGTNACGTTHCRAGGTVILSPIGKELEELVGTEMAAAMISLVSDGTIPDYHNLDNDAVLEDIKACAAKE